MTASRRSWGPIGIMLLCLGTAGCTTGRSIPHEALQASPNTAEYRVVQTRVFDIADEGKLLSACAALLQDTGYILGETDTSVGLITASKRRRIAADSKYFAKLLVFVYGGFMVPSISEDVRGLIQVFDACVVTHPLTDNRTAVRVVFQRQLLDPKNKVLRIEMIHTPDVYQEFFSRLSKAVFLEEQKI